MPRYFFIQDAQPLPENAQSGGYVLLNGTQHPQGPSRAAWDKSGVLFTNPDRPLWGEIDPKRSLHDQVVESWRAMLKEMDRCHAEGQAFDGVMLGGYAPMVASLYRLASGCRHAVFAAIMAPGVMPDGVKKGFVPAGVRMIPPPLELRDPFDKGEGERKSKGKRTLRYDRLVFASARPFQVERDPKTPDVPCRKEVIAQVESATIIDTKPALPPLPNADMTSYEQAVRDIVDEADAVGCPILLDGPPAETLLRIVALATPRGIPLYFLRTEILEAGKLGRVLGVEELPRF